MKPHFRMSYSVNHCPSLLNRTPAVESNLYNNHNHDQVRVQLSLFLVPVITWQKFLMTHNCPITVQSFARLIPVSLSFTPQPHPQILDLPLPFGCRTYQSIFLLGPTIKLRIPLPYVLYTWDNRTHENLMLSDSGSIYFGVQAQFWGSEPPRGYDGVGRGVDEIASSEADMWRAVRLPTSCRGCAGIHLQHAARARSL